MTLPTDPALLAPAVATPAQHRAWHEEIHTILAEDPAQPTSLPAGSAGHLAAHAAIRPLIGSGLPTVYNENDPSHGPTHHALIHEVINSRTYGVSAGPITISAGGTYSGVYESLVTTTPAVRVQTTQHVDLSGARIRHIQRGIRTITDGADLAVTDTSFLRLDPGSAIAGRAIEAEQCAQLVVEHCLLVSGNGILMLNDIVTAPTVGRVRYNECRNIGRYKRGLAELVQFFQANKVVLPGLELAWNHTVNQFGFSEVEDNINIYQSAGASGNPIDIHHNLIDGAFPLLASDAGYSGGGILTGDNGSDWTLIHDNTVVKTIQYGVAIYGGHDNHLQNNRVVSNGRVGGDASTLCACANVGVYVWNGDGTVDYGNDDATGNVSGWIQANGSRNDFWFPNCDPPGACTGNTSLAGTANAAAEQAERDAWEAARVAAGVTVGLLT